MSKISVLLPAYMEEDNLPRIIEQLEATFRGKNFEIIIINDDNINRSVETVKELEGKYGKVKTLFSNRRRGKTRAIKDGFNESQGEIIVVMDADLQYSPKDIPRLINALEHGDVANGLRVNRKDKTVRILESRIYNMLLHFFFGVTFRDCNSGLKVFKRGVMREIISQTKDRWHRYLLLLASEKGYKVVEIPVRHYPRAAGRPKFPSSPMKLIKGFYDLLSVRAFTLKQKQMHN